MIFRCPVDDTIMVRQRGKRKMVVDITSIAKQEIYTVNIIIIGTHFVQNVTESIQRSTIHVHINLSTAKWFYFYVKPWNIAIEATQN